MQSKPLKLFHNTTTDHKATFISTHKLKTTFMKSVTLCILLGLKSYSVFYLYKIFTYNVNEH